MNTDLVIKLDSKVWVPNQLLRSLSAHNVRALRRKVVVTPKATSYNLKPDSIVCYEVANGMTGLPYQTGLQLIATQGWNQQYPIVDERTVALHGHAFEKLPDPNHPLAPLGQEPFMTALNASVTEYEIFAAQGDTGVGKTVCFLNAYARSGQRGIVIVPTNYIADQWRDAAVKHLGLPADRIGRVGGGVKRWKDYPLTIAVLHNLFTGTLPAEFYRHYGMACFDEAHRLGAGLFSRAAGAFNARYRITLSATYERKDGCAQAIYAHFGRPVVVAAAKPLDTDVWVVDYAAQSLPHPKMPMPRKINFVTADNERNKLIINLLRRQWRKGRHVVVFSDRVQHLANLRWMAEHEAGIPAEHMGTFAAQDEDATGKRSKTSRAELERIKADCQIIFATYTMMKEAVDIPRLDCGIEATPKADNVQGIGRIRRVFTGKPKPRWIIIRDTVACTQWQRIISAGIKELESTDNIQLKYYGTATHLLRD